MANFGSQTSPKKSGEIWGSPCGPIILMENIEKKRGNFFKTPHSPPKMAPFPIVYWDELKMN